MTISNWKKPFGFHGLWAKDDSGHIYNNTADAMNIQHVQ